jgi:hypothetical protein
VAEAVHHERRYESTPLMNCETVSTYFFAALRHTHSAGFHERFDCRRSPCPVSIEAKQ